MAPTSRASASASSRIDQIAKHLDSKPFLELNTPFSTERSSRFEDERGNIKRPKPQEKKPEPPIQQKAAPKPPKMSNQKPHPALLIPGPIEFDDAVLDSMSHYRYD
jgi:alanine-glyoxylate transaminase/serine-glyoxylate transaminase/serine-pyruvate transaminase